MSLDIKTTNSLSRAIEILEAQEQLRAFEASIFPKLSKEDRHTVFKKYKRQGYPVKKKQMSTKEMKAHLDAIFGGQIG